MEEAWEYSAVKLAFRLTSESFARYEHGVIGLATLLDVFIKSDLLMAGAYDDPSGWYVRVPALESRDLHPLGLGFYAFSGEVQETRVEQHGLAIYYDVLVDCGTPISLLLTDPDARPEQGDLGRHVPDPGAWLQGLACLSLDWGDQEVLPVGHSLAATVSGIDRLVLRTGPGFGSLRSEVELPLTPFAPDQIYLTLRVNDQEIDGRVRPLEGGRVRPLGG